jgi:outer membrane protein TolC
MRNDRRNAAAALNNHMGLEWDAPVVIDSDALTPDDAELATLTNMSEEDIGLHIREYTAEALKNRPEVFQISAKKNAARHSALANASVYLCPTVFLNGGYQQTRSIAKSGASAPAASPAVTAIMDGLMPIFSPKGWNGSWSFTVGASYRFGGLAPWDPSWARTAQSSSQARQAEFEMEDLIRNIRVEIQQKFTRLAASAAVIPVQRENIRSAEEYFRVANIQFQNGIIDSAKLLSANVDLQNARTLYIQALFDFQNCKADLNRAIGKDLFRL